MMTSTYQASTVLVAIPTIYTCIPKDSDTEHAENSHDYQ